MVVTQSLTVLQLQNSDLTPDISIPYLAAKLGIRPELFLPSQFFYLYTKNIPEIKYTLFFFLTRQAEVCHRCLSSGTKFE